MALDPRLTGPVRRRPPFRRALRQWSSEPAVATALTHLGIKMSEAAWAERRLRQLLDRALTTDLEPLRPTAPTAPSAQELARLRTLSRTADAHVFAVYGILDALAQVVVAVSQAPAAEEIKFPALGRLLAGANDAARWSPLAELLDATFAADWFRDLRYRRNLVNYRGVVADPTVAAFRAIAWSATYLRVIALVDATLTALLDS